ncbi:MAG: DUF1850 domain-containing protein [Treponemataceae bacterium]
MLQTRCLALIDVANNKVVATFDFTYDKAFSIGVIHSVNKSLVEEGFIIKGSKIYLDWTRYYAFGAGVATEVEGNQKLTINDDGSMTITGINRHIPSLTYVISTVYDHSLSINNQVINLTTLALKDKAIRFEIQKKNRFIDWLLQLKKHGGEILNFQQTKQ